MSPLLANLYMRRFLLAWKVQGHEKRLDARIVNYADDFVILTRGHADEALAQMRRIMGQMRLTVNERKTRRCALPAETFIRFQLPYLAGFLAGQAFVAYQRRGGAELAPLPDFYIGAHAAVSGYRLLTREANRYRRYFPTVDIVAPF